MKTRDMILIAMFSALIAAGAFMRIPTPICPITLQILFTTLAGVILGGKNGAISVLVYILLGLAGVPVFTGGGGISYVLQPTFGYLIGFVIGTFVTGTITHGGEPTMKRMLTGCLTGLAIVFFIGVVYYWAISKFWLGNNIETKALLMSCLFLPLPGDILLCVFTSVLGKRVLPVFKRYNKSEA